MMKSKERSKSTDGMRDLWTELTDGLLYTHSRLNANAKKTLETASFLYALIDLLEEKGLLSIEELDARKEVVAARLFEQYRQDGAGVMLQDPEFDKYSFAQAVQIDCASRVHLCRTACCRLPFALSKQDIREGIVYWDLGRPYLIAHNGHGTCSHLDPETRTCTIWQYRPVPCRGFDCRSDQRIWLDFENRIVNSDIYRNDWPQCLVQTHEQGTVP